MNKAVIVVENSINFFEIINMQLIEFKEKDQSLQMFYSSFYQAIHGCSCKKSQNLVQANKIYEENIKNIPINLKEEMKNILNAEKILFFKDKKFLLFEF